MIIMSAKEMFEDLKINEWLELIKEDKNLNGAYISIYQYIYLIEKELQELKKQVENYKKLGFKYLMDKNNNLEIQQKEFIKYLEDEKDRLIKETSHYYIDSFDRQHAVNETIYDEVDVILQKYRKIIGDDK